MKKIRIGNLTHNRKSCNCGNTATWFLFTIADNDYKKTYYYCDKCMEIIKNELLTNKNQ